MIGEAVPELGDAPARSGRSRRWWPLVIGITLLIVVAWILTTAWVGVSGSHPAGWLTLAASGTAALGCIVWSVLGEPGSGQRPIWVTRLTVLVAVVGATMAVVVMVYTRPLSARPIALDALNDRAGVTIETSWTQLRLLPEEPFRIGLAFYPGAKVDPQAYAHILRPVAEAGYPVVILKQPYNLAILDSDAADAIVGDPDDQIDQWVVGGHSLGGAMAARYAEPQRDELVGLLLYAAYPVNDMSDRSNLNVLSVTGSNDEVVSQVDMKASVAELPSAAMFVSIEGAIHSFFGDYGLQRGDGTATISRQRAQDEIAVATLDLMRTIEAAT